MHSWLPFAAKVLGLVLVFALVAPVILPFYSGLQIWTPRARLATSGDWLAPLAIWGLLGFSLREIATQRTHAKGGGGSYASV